MEQYRRVKIIGKGAYGAAVLVRSDKHLYVMKEVVLHGMSHREQMEAQHEATVLRELDHPNIIRYVDSAVQHGKLCIVMAYAAGGDLDAYIQRKREKRERLEVNEALAMFAQMTLALKYLHSNHILHRDLKSKNVFLDKFVEGTELPIVKLGDFGIAKVLAHTRDIAKTQIGTPYYLSPEICQDQPYSYSSDMWSAGIVLFEMLALRVPFEARGLHELINKIVQSPAPRIPAQYQHVEGLSDLVNSLLEKEASKRPTAADILTNKLVQNALHDLRESLRQSQRDDGPSKASGSRPTTSHQLRSGSAKPRASVGNAGSFRSPSASSRQQDTSSALSPSRERSAKGSQAVHSPAKPMDSWRALQAGRPSPSGSRVGSGVSFAPMRPPAAQAIAGSALRPAARPAHPLAQHSAANPRDRLREIRAAAQLEMRRHSQGARGGSQSAASAAGEDDGGVIWIAASRPPLPRPPVQQPTLGDNQSAARRSAARSARQLPQPPKQSHVDKREEAKDAALRLLEHLKGPSLEFEGEDGSSRPVTRNFSRQDGLRPPTRTGSAADDRPPTARSNGAGGLGDTGRHLNGSRSLGKEEMALCMAGDRDRAKRLQFLREVEAHKEHVRQQLNMPSQARAGGISGSARAPKPLVSVKPMSLSDEQQQEYLQRRREAAENARRINADLGRGPDVSVAFAVCDDGDMNHAQRVREEAERRKRQEQQDREAALEQARREAQQARAAAHARQRRLTDASPGGDGSRKSSQSTIDLPLEGGATITYPSGISALPRAPVIRASVDLGSKSVIDSGADLKA